MASDRRKPNVRILLAGLALVVSVAIGVLQYRGPAPLGPKASTEIPSAARMRQTLVELLGDPAEIHSTGTAAGEAFLRRLEAKIQSLGLTTRRIEVPWNPQTQGWHPNDRIDSMPADAVLKNLLVTVPGRRPELAPILVATHHDSCHWGPGAGDAGSAVVALVEHLRIMSTAQPIRTTHYLFTDGEEYGLLGAYSIAALDPKPFPEPFFVLNFDARGTTGGVPMFETHTGNRAWVKALIGRLAEPKITSSLAVTVYRTLPNATDFHVWHGELGWPGFNFATIGGAHHYHRPSDLPENVSDRTLQHMGDQLYSMHRAIDTMEMLAVGDVTANANAADNSVFFDLYGVTVVQFSETTQRGIAIFTLVLAVLVGLVQIRRGGPRMRARVGMIFKHALSVIAAVACGTVVGWGVQTVLYTTPWRDLRYTPVDFQAGLATLAAAFLIATLVLEWLQPRANEALTSMISDWTWLVSALLGAVLAFVLPGGAYLLVLPGWVYFATRLLTQEASWAAWFGWGVLIVIAGPLLALLVQALGPWRQPLYGGLVSLMAVKALTVWNVSRPPTG